MKETHSIVKKSGLRKMLKEQCGVDAEPMEPDGKFRFECARCGNCCFGRYGIAFTPFDIYQGAKTLGMSCREFMDAYTTVSPDAESGLPAVYAKSDGKGACSLLDFSEADGKCWCRIYDTVPKGGRRFPPGQAKNLGTGKKTFFIPDGSCRFGQDTEKERIVREWQKYGREHADEYAAAADLLAACSDGFSLKDLRTVTESMFIASYLGIFSGEGDRAACAGNEVVRTVLYERIPEICYMDFDTEKPFVPQAEDKHKELEELIVDGTHAFMFGRFLLNEVLGLDPETDVEGIRDEISDRLTRRVASGKDGTKEQVLSKITEHMKRIMKEHLDGPE